ncbi:MAG: hypothetical protein SFT81_02110 [Candidatus Caenarcaniphilales bacterium]|nr:hypothetical protein [Candidatus Caenarcaniphilales bacterium]
MVCDRSDEISTQEKSLSSSAKRAGVNNFAFFKDAGYRGMYNLSLKQIKSLKGLEEKKNLYDFMGSEEMAANLFRLTQTEAKLQKTAYAGQSAAENVAQEVGKTVRRTMIEISGNKPEDLPMTTDINRIKGALKASQKDFAKLDVKKRNKFK